MSRSFIGLIMVLGALLALAPALMVVAAQESRAYYVCGCKDDCDCTSISKSQGKCTCGANLVAVHFLAIEKDAAVFCRCGADCTCERTKADPSKCGCGKPVKMVSVKGKYVCSCGPDCKCSTISDKAGKCTCGKDLKLVG